MRGGRVFNKDVLQSFERRYDTLHEYRANRSRAEFIRKFPLSRLKGLKLTEYVIGKQTPTFCAHVEAKTRSWASIQGSTAIKFGIYYGTRGEDKKQTYRFSKKFGTTRVGAYSAVHNALIALLGEGAKVSPDFLLIDRNPLSQLFKAKILSLYFPKKFLNVCSDEHLKLLAMEFKLPAGLPHSEYQFCLYQIKLQHQETSAWSNPKFMAFLYETYINEPSTSEIAIKKPKRRSHPEINFEEVQAQRNAIGKAAEKFALKWEIERLDDADLKGMVAEIDDRTKRPSYGYDFLSHTSETEERYIEVKSVAKTSKNGDYRFFLSANEHTISLTKAHADRYFFYLVFFDSHSKPTSLIPVRASWMYLEIVPEAASYVARFNISKNFVDA